MKSIILKNFKLLQNDPDTGRIFSQPALILFKHDKNIANFLVTSVFQTSEQPGTFKDVRANCFCASLLRTQIHTPRHTRARTLSNKKLNNHRQRAIAIALPGFFYIFDITKLPSYTGESLRKKSIKITDHFTCTSANVIYRINCTLCKKLYIGETGRRLSDRFREHLRDVEKDDQNVSKPVAVPKHITLRCPKYNRKTEGGKTLLTSSILLRNSLPVKIRSSESINSFKRKYIEYVKEGYANIDHFQIS